GATGRDHGSVLGCLGWQNFRVRVGHGKHNGTIVHVGHVVSVNEVWCRYANKDIGTDHGLFQAAGESFGVGIIGEPLTVFVTLAGIWFQDTATAGGHDVL